MRTVIEAENVSKLYRLGKIGTGTLSHDLRRWWATTRGFEDPYSKVASVNDRTQKASTGEYVWALQDINFEIQRGDVVGVIGKNGAGKSTLLKILSRITAPSTGEIKLKGRIGALLEVGTGFHPEMTGRENVFMNGTVMGMRKHEIRKSFDEIVDFSGVAKYIDTPVKRYSSGMMVRLGFAVAAFLEPEILIVDEVLAVGDAEFQKRAIGRIQLVSKGEGRTVLFVSHNLAAIRSLCKKGILLANGRVSKVGEVNDVAQEYLGGNSSFTISESFYSVDKELFVVGKHNGLEITSITLNNFTENVSTLVTGSHLKLRIEYNALEKFISPAFVLKIKDSYENELIRLSNMPISGYPIKSFEGKGYVELDIERLPLVGGDYSIDLGLVREKVQWFFNVENAIRFRIEPTDFYKSGIELDNTRGKFVVNHKWNHVQLS